MHCLTQPGQFISERCWLEYSRRKTCDASRSLNELENIRKYIACACVLEVGTGMGAQRFRVKCKQKMCTLGSGRPLQSISAAERALS